ncbi:SDR family NAD(P)-dependent oxidoreductase [Pseudosulfitobacter pseudonitzschiae]|uniref:SDR family NAD(P)-dependent oxidoreductase n=1 Tax=Pseudosulfitobacter pseudonitzschiae TaxID=1402135 RepID=UPI001AF5B976|nr:SDR family oxidoreductase [Pseudosulfitobacter pseudonitzschiae]MBM1816555.1 SDR family oxidoreductase [Pseudosulfitobacter pseudonitzschiae]MBM1833153.1 SDR family oxidoreductase [Pseudosulfitobacter pseudonitzschiae]MBM1838021.1 SDR family oxidoreductase [Pseudosulfitobacter pseudonitzschiae]MBM1843282.1 SDR family oxidoreductase [Pseudosulfitobacter pseudonitzschiae]MBM1848148.1 SDR family oxidoreductase [Pseudosulfitobacter pseudonitzschiae]
MPNTALITGASSGIGMEFARYHAAQGGDVILTARRKDALDALASEVQTAHNVTAHVFALDLGAEGGAQALYDQVKDAGLSIDILINNAGFGGQGRFLERDLARDLAMIDLNVKALVTLTHLFANDMVANGGGKILNVASTAGFMPGPLQATYFATKAFVKSFSQAIDQENRKRGLTCTALCPGYVKTEFADVSDLNGTDLVNNGGATPDTVARHGYDAMMRGDLVTVNDAKLGFAVNWIIPLLPRRMVLKMVQRMQTKK